MKLITYSSAIMITGLTLVQLGCASVETKQANPETVAPTKPISMPVGHNWQVIEEAPKLTDERGHVHFQTEQSIQQTPTQSTPSDETNRKIKTIP